jgi:hypothetical protein
MNTTDQNTVQPWQLPAVETLLNVIASESVWNKDVQTNPLFKEQVTTQRALIDSWQTVTKIITPGQSTAVVATNRDTALQIARFFDLLTRYLEEDQARSRIILYLPMEFTEPLNGPNTPDVLTANYKRFANAYLEAFETMLHTQDVRANFVDGNVLEPELRIDADHSRVVKVTHLIPSLVQSGFFTFKDVIELAEQNTDNLIVEGILEACEVMLDLNLVTKQNLELLPRYQSLKTITVNSEQMESSETVLQELEYGLHKARKINPASSTPNRTIWLQKNAIDHAIAVASARLAIELLDGKVLWLTTMCTEEMLRVGIDAIRQASLVKPTVFTKLKSWVAQAEDTHASIAVKDAIQKLYLHLYSAGVIDGAVLKERKLRIPKLQGPFSENLEHFTPSVSEFGTMVANMMQDDVLRWRVYPAAIMLGSQLKGYDIGDADADVAVFIKPGPTVADQSELAARLQKVFDHERIGGSVLMFWLEADYDKPFTIREITQTTNAPGLSTWTHILMDGAWVGEAATVRDLRRQLLTPYCFNPDTDSENQSTRYRWLEELERDAILYRLLHKGYERFHPIRSPMDTLHGAMIDGASALYDPHFRFIATELYLTRVFLPNLGQRPE